MPINLNANPYYDDFDDEKKFYQLLFRPGFSVQARELTQLQTILKDQIAKFGDHMFKQGSLVLPGNSFSDLNVCYVKLVDTAYDITKLSGKFVTGQTSGLQALIQTSTIKTSVDPATFYVSYSNTGTNGEQVFLADETLLVDGVSVGFSTISDTPCGGASIAYINKGVFFVNSTFVTVSKQSTVIGKYTSSPSCHVLLKIEESIVTSNEDSSLLDPAQGSYNYAAPGADRLKINLTLTTLPLGSTISEDYIEIMRYNEGVLEEHLRYAKYNELEKNLARRTYDESGNYVASGLEVTAQEHLKTPTNGGKYPVESGGDTNKFVYSVSAGKAYVKGFEVEAFKYIEAIANKARDASHINSSKVNMNPSYGQYFYVTGVKNLPSLKERSDINVLDAIGGNVIGTATLLAIDFHEANTNESSYIYKVFVYDVDIDNGVDHARIGALNFGGTNIGRVVQKYSVTKQNALEFQQDEEITSGTKCAQVVKWIPQTGILYAATHCVGELTPDKTDIITGTTSGSIAKAIYREIYGKNDSNTLLVPLPYQHVLSVKPSSGVLDTLYKTYYETNVTIVGGTGSFNVTGMTIDTLELGNLIMCTSEGIQPFSSASLAVDGLSMSFSSISPANTTLKVICATTKNGPAEAAPKTKTYVSGHVETLTDFTGTINLAKADIISITSIVSNNTSENDVSDRYIMDNGQSDYSYKLGFLKIRPGKNIPAGVLTITYDYFNHGPGDYFSIDSYADSGYDNYYESNVLTYRSKNSGKVFDLRTVLDFRSRVSDSGGFVGGTAVLSNLAQIGSRITTSLQYYVGRKDVITLTPEGKLKVLTGIPALSPRLPLVQADALVLANVIISPYTYKVNSIDIQKTDSRGYTMSDISKINARVARIEDYVLLTQTETNLVNTEVIDAKTGLSRFKSGYLVENFGDADHIADLHNKEFTVTYQSGRIRPAFEAFEAPLQEIDTDMMLTGSVLTLPYTITPFAQQKVSSKVTNVNPFSVFNWTGSMLLSPSGDSWAVNEDLPTIVNSSTESRTDVVFSTRALPPNPPPIINNITNNAYDIVNVYNEYTNTYVPTAVPNVYYNGGDDSDSDSSSAGCSDPGDPGGSCSADGSSGGGGDSDGGDSDGGDGGGDSDGGDW